MPVAPSPAQPVASKPIEAKRVEHPPNGSFDAVVLQSGGREDLRPRGVALSGPTVYTVYLPAGDRKESRLRASESVRY